jgi:hypothetical protein
MDACLEFLSFTRHAERLMFGLLLDRNFIFAMTVPTAPGPSTQRLVRKKALGGTIWYSWLETDVGMRYCASLAVPRTILATFITSLVLITVRWKLYQGKIDAILLPAQLVSMGQYLSSFSQTKMAQRSN